jgi:hypothetical protein
MRDLANVIGIIRSLWRLASEQCAAKQHARYAPRASAFRFFSRTVMLQRKSYEILMVTQI